MIPMAQHHGITPLAWSPLAGGVLAGEYSKEDLQEDSNKDGNGSGRKQMSQSMGQLNERSIEIGEKVKEIAQEIGRAPSQVSLNWLLQQPGGTIPIVGARKLSHVEDNLQAVDFTLTPEQIDRLNEVSNYKPALRNLSKVVYLDRGNKNCLAKRVLFSLQIIGVGTSMSTSVNSGRAYPSCYERFGNVCQI